VSSTDSVAAARATPHRTWAVGIDSYRRVAVGCFGAAALIGLVFAFVGLDTHSLWYDELFTVRLLEPLAGTTLLSRIATDVHPPIYLLLLSLHAQLFGGGDAALRAFSAVAACGAVVVFVAATGRAFSLPGRLFGAAMATGSLFWFVQAQNARSYALCLLIGTGVLALALPLLLRQGPRGRLTAAMFALMAIGSFVHFYLMYLSLAVLIMLALADRRALPGMAAMGFALLVAVGLYGKLVIDPHAQVSLGDNWYRNDVDWYVSVLGSCLHHTLGDLGLVAILLCVPIVVLTRTRPAGQATTGEESGRRDPVPALLVGVPLLVLAGGIASSTLLAPNFFDRNFLVVSPFLWGIAARLYDTAIEKASATLRLALTAVLGVLVLAMSTMVTARLGLTGAPSLYEPFRQSAQWIRSLEACRGEVLPVVTTDDPAWYKPGYAEFINDGAYSRYLDGFARPRLVFGRHLTRDRLPEDLKRELQARLDGAGCPVLAWAAHNMEPAIFALLQDRLLRALDRADAAPLVVRTTFEDGKPGYVLHVRR
jgi:hypothetical protein